MSDRAAAVVRDYYDALREGKPLEPYFRESEAETEAGSTVKFGISEGLFGYDEVREALREQTETTAEWTVESGRLEVTEWDGTAAVADEVTMAWTDVESGDRRRFETRWSGTLVRRGAGGNEDEVGEGHESENGDENENAPAWQFTTMHVSTADDL